MVSVRLYQRFSVMLPGNKHMYCTCIYTVILTRSGQGAGGNMASAWREDPYKCACCFTEQNSWYIYNTTYHVGIPQVPCSQQRTGITKFKMTIVCLFVLNSRMLLLCGYCPHSCTISFKKESPVYLAIKDHFVGWYSQASYLVLFHWCSVTVSLDK